MNLSPEGRTLGIAVNRFLWKGGQSLDRPEISLLDYLSVIGFPHRSFGYALTMIEFIKNNFGSILSLGVISTALGFSYRLYSRSIFEADLHSASDDSFAFVMDSERNTSKDKYLYYIKSKVVFDVFVGDALKLTDASLVIKADGKYWKVQWPQPNSPDNVRSFFGDNKQNQTWEDTSSGKRFIAKGVAERGGEAFDNLPSGGYSAFAVFILDRFTVTLPLRLASLRDGGHSSICGSASVRRRLGRSIDPEEVAKKYPEHSTALGEYTRVRLCILDFDLLPFISPFWSFQLKKS